MNPDTEAYHAAQDPEDRAICDTLHTQIVRGLSDAQNKIWHGHPVWFLEGNPIVGYSALKDGVRLLFWGGQSFDEPGLEPQGTFKAAEVRYTSPDQVDETDLARWLEKARSIQWDYKNLVKRKGKLVRLLLATAMLATATGAAPLHAQDIRAGEVIELNRRILEEQIVDGRADLFRGVALDAFLVVAPGGRVEGKTEAIEGVQAWDATAIQLTDERVVFHGTTAVVIGRLEIDGEMRPVGTLPPMKFMAVFVDDGDGWRILARSLTPCFEMAIQNGFC